MRPHEKQFNCMERATFKEFHVSRGDPITHTTLICMSQERRSLLHLRYRPNPAQMGTQQSRSTPQMAPDPEGPPALPENRLPRRDKGGTLVARCL